MPRNDEDQSFDDEFENEDESKEYPDNDTSTVGQADENWHETQEIEREKQESVRTEEENE